jgi:hypothetical protein
MRAIEKFTRIRIRVIKAMLLPGILAGFVIICLFISCSGNSSTASASTALAVTTSTQTTLSLEQKRSDVLKYLVAFNGIENNVEDAASKIVFPTAINNTADLTAWNTGETSLLAAYDNAIKLLGDLKPSSLETATAAHLQQARSFYQSERTAEKAYNDAVNTGNNADIDLKWKDLNALDEAASALNRATEQLMQQYNISDAEVSYRFRGI